MARARHCQQDSATYHVTTRTRKGRFHLADVREKSTVLAALDFYRKRDLFKLFGFVVMDNHLHVVIQPSDGRRLGDIVRNIKTWTSGRNARKPPGQPLWERRYDDNEVRSLDELREVLAYVHGNPVRAGMVAAAEEYPWSSVHNYLGNGKAIIEIDTDWR